MFSYLISQFLTMVLIDDSIYIAENDKVDAVIESALWRNNDIFTFLMVKLGYYSEEKGNYKFWLVSLNIFSLYFCLKIIINYWFDFIFLYRVIQKFMLEIKDKGKEQKNDTAKQKKNYIFVLCTNDNLNQHYFKTLIDLNGTFFEFDCYLNACSNFT